MTLTRIQALALALGLVLIGIAAAWGDSTLSATIPTELDHAALERGDLAPEPPAAAPADQSRFTRDVDFDADLFRIQL